MSENPQMEDGPLYRNILFSGRFVKAAHYDRLREDYDRLRALIPEGLRDQVAVDAARIPCYPPVVPLLHFGRRRPD